MSLNKVVEEILREGEQSKSEIIRKGEKERDDQVLQAEKKVADDRAKMEARTAAMIVQMEQHELSSAELEARKLLLSAQRQVMEDLREQILKELERYPSDKRKKLYSRLVSKAQKELGEGYVYSSKNDKTLLQLPKGFSSGGVIDCRGGLVFESKDRSVRLDYRFESLLEEVWNKKMQEIFAKLFG